MKQEQVPLGRALLATIFSNTQELKLPWYRRLFRDRPGLRALSRNKYKPHQGDREKARRVHQRERGII